MKKALLASIAILAAGAAQAQNDDGAAMQSMTLSVLNGLGAAKQAQADTTETADGELTRLVHQALEQGQSDAYVEALVAEAVDSGEIEVPDELISTEGTVDTRTLIASLVSKSVDAPAPSDVSTLKTEAEVTAGVAEASPEAGTEVAAATGPGGKPVAEASEAPEVRWHKVRAGDSLAAISLTYYGTTKGHERIFRANRNLIDRPSLIYVGQVLRIP